MNHIMVDLETLGTAADSVIMSIGAVKFDLEPKKIDDEGFYTSITIDSNLAQGRRIQEDTLCWWMKQTPEAQIVFHEAKQPLEEALCDFSDWIGPGYKGQIWSNGADFDIPMLAPAYRQFCIGVPWRFWDSRCFRTYKNLPGAKNVVLAPSGVKHNALSDAVNQAVALQNIHAALFGKKGKT